MILFLRAFLHVTRPREPSGSSLHILKFFGLSLLPLDVWRAIPLALWETDNAAASTMANEWRFTPGEYGMLGWIETVFQFLGQLVAIVGFFFSVGALPTFFDGNEITRLGSMILAIFVSFIYLLAVVERVFVLKEGFSLIVNILNLIAWIFLTLSFAYTGYPAIIALLACSFFFMAQITKLLAFCSDDYLPDSLNGNSTFRVVARVFVVISPPPPAARSFSFFWRVPCV
jgi:hypothetical protein